MSQNAFTIIISAQDKASAAIKKVNDAVSNFTRPLAEVKKVSAALGKELGIDKVGKSLGKVGQAASDVAEKIGRVIAPLAAIGELAKKWGDVGAEIGRTSTTLGVSSRDLQLWRGAAQLAGVSAEAMTSGMKTLGDTMQGAYMGRNPKALGIMGQIGLQLEKTKSGAVDVTKALMNMSRIIASHQGEAETQGLLAREFGLEALLPLLRQGPEAVKRYLDMVEKSGAVMGGPALAAANAFYLSLANLDLAFTGLKNAIASKLGPALDPLIDKLKDWIIVHRELIATKVEKFVEAFSKAIEKINWTGVIRGVENFCIGVSRVVDWLSGLKGIMTIVVTYMSLSFLVSIYKLTTAFWDLSAAMAATPIGWITLAVAGLAIVGYQLYRHWDFIALWWKHLWGGMSDDAYKSALKILDAKKMLNPAQKAGVYSNSVTIPITPAVNSTTQSIKAGANSPTQTIQAAANSPVSSQPGILGLIRKLEGSGDSAVSKAGAIGRYQIMPDTARTYGFDPSKLKIPAYNEMAATAIVKDLSAKYNGNTDAILAAYHSGPGGANKFLAKGISALGPEGQKYLNHAHSILGQTGPAVETPYFIQAPYGINPNLAKTGPAVETPYSTPSPAIVNPAMAQNGQGTGAVTVLISFENAPKGMKTKTQTSGGIIANTKIRYAMPEFGAVT
jgi:hypothetical protein